MLGRVLGLVGVTLAIGLLSGLLAGCGGPPHFEPGPGKVRISPIPESHGKVNFPANVTVDGTGLYIFTHGVRRIGDAFQLNVSAIVDPGATKEPGDHAVQGWLGKGDSMQVEGLRVKMLAVYEQQSEGDVQVTAPSGAGATATAHP